jgi:hypothetical protein
MLFEELSNGFFLTGLDWLGCSFPASLLRSAYGAWGGTRARAACDADSDCDPASLTKTVERRRRQKGLADKVSLRMTEVPRKET